MINCRSFEGDMVGARYSVGFPSGTTEIEGTAGTIPDGASEGPGDGSGYSEGKGETVRELSWIFSTRKWRWLEMGEGTWYVRLA
jgi:hypothetical protein